jgi:hypothetical protein
MSRRVWSEKANRGGGSLLAALSVLVGFPVARAQAQVVQNCEANQYVDRTAPGADRSLPWDFGITTAPERCMQVRVGQTVVWNGDLDVHPLGGQGGDAPNPISLHQNGSVTFNSAGTFGFVCLSHSSMKGAIKVVPVTSSVPALPGPAAVALTVLLLGAGSILIRRPARARRGSRRLPA